jgi:aerotaxis receptor
MKKNFPVTGVEKDYADTANILSTTDLKGAITYTNSDFNEVSGFDDEELLHKNHNVVRHPDMPPAAFEQLWKTAKSGKSWMGIVKNRCKNGDHYWVDAYVTPIVRNGIQEEYQSVRTKPKREHVERAEKLYAMLNEGRQPWQWRLPRLSLNLKLSLAMFLVLSVALIIPVMTGHLSMTSAGISLVVGLGMVGLMNFLFVRPLDILVAKAKEVCDDRVASWVYTGRVDELGQILLAFKMLESDSGGIVGRIADVSKELTTQANGLSDTLQKNSENVYRQQAETEQVATAVNEMSASIQEVSQNAQLAADATQSASDETEAGKRVVYEATDSIQSLAQEIENTASVITQLEQDSDNISSVVDVIRGIAEQTNLLALNAAIEAARAGEQGRGFAVVADEVRTLASRTQESTTEIQNMIERLQTASRRAASVMSDSRTKAEGSVGKATEAAASLDAIMESVNTIKDMTVQIAAAVEEQSAVAGQVDQSVLTIRELAEDTAQGTAQNEQACGTLNDFAGRMSELSEQFRVKRMQ